MFYKISYCTKPYFVLSYFFVRFSYRCNYMNINKIDTKNFRAHESTKSFLFYIKYTVTIKKKYK